MNYEELKNTIKNLADSQIVGFYLDPDLLSLRLDFSFGLDKTTSVELSHIYHIVLSQDPFDEAGRGFLVLEISIDSLEKNRKELLDSLGYMYKYNEEDNTQKDEMYYIKILGDLCLKVICGKVRVFKQL